MCQEAKWKEICNDALVKMMEYVEPFITPIWKYKDENDIKLHGSGSYFKNPHGQFIITNEHVAKYNGSYRLTHSFKGSSAILNIRNPFTSVNSPIDVAISKIETNAWLEHKSEGDAIPIKCFATKHSPVEGELLFFAGFSGERSRVSFETCISRGTPFLTQECPFPESSSHADERYHISIPYPPEKAETSDPSISLPDPHGFSGSLLWDTKRVECELNNTEWDPSMAKITGVIWGWPTSNVCIVATRIEHINIEKMTSEYQNE